MRTNMLKQYADHLRERARSAFMAKRLMEIFKGKATAADEDVDVTDIDNGAENETHFAEQVADLLVRSGRFDDKAEALDFLLGSQHGGALLQRLRQSKRASKTRKAFTMPTRQELLKNYLKSAGGLDAARSSETAPPTSTKPN